MDSPFIIYVSGDKGSAELLELCDRKGVPTVVRDIRGTANRGNLVRLFKLGLQTTPQIFDGNATHIGGYDAVAPYLETLPDKVVYQSVEGAD